MARKIIQIFTSGDGDRCALADDGTTWWWRETQPGLPCGWQPLFDALPDDGPVTETLQQSAAPDLLAALKAILPWHDSHPAEVTDNPLINRCRAAIAKATAP